MSDKIEQMFSNLRRGPWNVDPTAVPQEGFSGNGNVESAGWIADDAITADTIQANAVTAGKIDADAVTAREIQADSVTASEIAANTITAAEIAANTITANEIAGNTITANEIAANTITAAEIAVNTITASEIAAGAITASELAANSVTATHVVANTLTANEIAASAITASELAADSVITSKIMAGNVVSSKIELTISGKNFGANDGAISAPGVYFDASSNTGMFRNASGGVTVCAIGLAGMAFGTGGHNISTMDLRPSADATNDLGTTSQRWDVVYRVSESAVSDEREKRDIADAPLGLDFVKTLKPRVFRWRDSVDTQAREEATAAFDEEALQAEVAPHERRIDRIRRLQLAGRISDDDANAQVEQARAVLDEIRKRYVLPIEEARQKRRPGKRLHYGLIAQEVKAALDKAGVDSMDAAFWQEAPDGSQSLSYSEIIPILIRGMQEQQAQIDDQKRRIEYLESHGPTSKD